MCKLFSLRWVCFMQKWLWEMFILLRTHNAHAHNKIKKAENVLLWHIIRHAYMGIEEKKTTDSFGFLPDCLTRPTDPKQMKIKTFPTLRHRALKPAKQTKLTYSLIAFNEDNVSRRFRWDGTRLIALIGEQPQKWSWWILIQELWILNRSPPSVPFPHRLPYPFVQLLGILLQLKCHIQHEFHVRWRWLCGLVKFFSAGRTTAKSIIIKLHKIIYLDNLVSLHVTASW